MNRLVDVLLISTSTYTAWDMERYGKKRFPKSNPIWKALKKANALPVNSNGNLNRTAILKKFGLGTGSMSVVLSRAPRLKDLLDRYDITAKDPAYRQYKYTKFKGDLKLLLEAPDLRPKLWTSYQSSNA